MDVSHELGALRFVVDSPLSSKVAMFNQQVNQHKQGQLLNPFATTDGRASPKPSFSKDEYGKPLAGSLTEARGQKANMHVMREMIELCQIIDSEGYDVKDEPTMRVIPFGELFNIYNYISDKCVGICLRARKHKLIEFEGEMLFQRRDDNVPIFLLKPIHEIRHELMDKIESIKRCGSPAPQATSVLLDKKGLSAPKGATPNTSRTPSPSSSKAATPVREVNPPKPTTETPKIQLSEVKTEEVVNKTEAEVVNKTEAEVVNKTETETQAQTEIKETPTPSTINKEPETITAAQQAEVQEEPKLNGVPETQPQQLEVQSNLPDTPAPKTETEADLNNNQNTDLPTIVIEASAVYESPANAAETAASA